MNAKKQTKPASRPVKLSRILVPVDFSELSVAALPQARLFAKNFRAELILLHVIETYPIDYVVGLPESKQLHASLAERARRELQKLTVHLLGLKPRSLVRWGKPFQEIVSAAQELDVDMIVLTTHGHTGLKHVYLGSTAERIVRHAHCPVLVVRSGLPV
jgi:universal stress protein A